MEENPNERLHIFVPGQSLLAVLVPGLPEVLGRDQGDAEAERREPGDDQGHHGLLVRRVQDGWRGREFTRLDLPDLR
jgi:hypothetical protein